MVQPTVVPALGAGRDYPGDLAQFRAWFPTDMECLDYLDWLRWPEGFVCPHCDSRDSLVEVGRFRCRGCRTRTSVTAGTIFDKTRIPLTVWFEVAWLMTTGKGGVSAAHLHRMLPVSSYQSAWAMLGKFRSVMSSAGSEPLEGRVEVDETFIGGPRPGVVGRGALGKTLVAGGVEITTKGWGRARLAVIPDASAASLREFVVTNIRPGAVVVSDGWRAYPPALKGYDHVPMVVSATGLPAHESLPAVHRLFALVKHTLDGAYYGAGTPEHLPEYLDEFIFRFNRRHSRQRGLLFARLLQRCVVTKPVIYKDLVRISKPKPVPPAGVTGPRTRPGSLDTNPANRPWRAQTNQNVPSKTMGT